jgi:hypothetical protein
MVPMKMHDYIKHVFIAEDVHGNFVGNVGRSGNNKTVW